MLVASAQRGGLYANLTKIAWFVPPDAETERRQAACDEILERMRVEATRPARTLADAFADCRHFYADAGFPDEWRLHHQRGITGYDSRDYRREGGGDVRPHRRRRHCRRRRRWIIDRSCRTRTSRSCEPCTRRLPDATLQRWSRILTLQ